MGLRISKYQLTLFNQNLLGILLHFMYRLELKIPPAILVLLFAVVMWFVSSMSPWAVIQIPGKEWGAGALWIMGLALIIVAAIEFISAKTTANPLTPGLATSIVTTGVYRLSRNPMYAGFLLMLAAWGVFLANVLSVLLLPLFVVYLNRFQIIPEENALLAKFGNDYARYLKSTRRWV
ncbi:methyltransferase family protein [Nitrosomonas ureae]|uniref:Protein-S-isoprenylcysteine O-methyltransferase Ste14 n=1 Tax=Nitrosomonas ureae TaxID=44577 RepID=A0A1H5XIP8_9PROT|nr:isoprenylcysteine carboxylmethyltransferase family protein [Nitrosomonas ureae]SEG11335.1 Protein-S-isoprenylcysteine O-methyltransferase Ste14 [Nitrosomonas ureae]